MKHLGKMALKDYIHEFYKYQRETGAYGNINKELNEFIQSIQEEKGKKGKLLIKQMKRYLIKKKRWDIKKDDWKRG